MDETTPIWLHDPADEQRYGQATDGMCPADGSKLTTEPRQTGIHHCETCRRCFDPKDGRRVGRTWWTGPKVPPDPSKHELRHLLVSLLRSAQPHPVEHPTMWRAWGDACRRLGLNPDDYRIPTSDPELSTSDEAPKS